MGIFKKFMEALDNITTIKYFRKISKIKSKRIPLTIKKASKQVTKKKTKLTKNYSKIFGKPVPKKL